ncbi:oligosaccharyltransferase complex subunit epsilon [Savitreella phatthalungensis]
MAPRKSAKKVVEDAATTPVKTGNDPIDTLVNAITTTDKSTVAAGKSPARGESAVGGAKADFSYATIVQDVWKAYLRETPHRLKLIDAFLVFLIYVGVVQFAYCVLVGNYPFNAFLAGFGATIGQFVLAVGLRIQSNTANRGEFPQISPERAFGDFLFGSVLLHFAVVNFLG